MVTYWFLFLILFGAVVFIHELGHFIVAKLSGVFVERFALGFGPAILKKQWGETEYAICALPLGGYVKMRGEDVEEAKDASVDPRSFAQKPPGVRIAIAVMGPTSNLLLPIIVFTLLFMVGMPTLASKIGWVMPGSPAEKAGLRPGDVVKAIQKEEIWKWSDLEDTIRKYPNKPVDLVVDRAGSVFHVTVVPKSELDTDLFGKEVSAGKIGVSPNSFRAAVGIGDSKSPAAKLGLKTGDVITKINGAKIDYFWQLEEQFKNNPKDKKISFERWTDADASAPAEKKEFTLAASVKTLNAAGIANGELYIREVKSGTVAAEKGLKAGDHLVALNGSALDTWAAFQQKIRQNAGEKLVLTIQRQGKIFQVDFVPEEIVDKNTFTKEREKRRQLGVVSAALSGEVLQKDERYLNPFSALFHAVQTTSEMTVLTFSGLVKLFTGQLSLKKSLGGPISIFYLAGGSYETGGWTAYFRMMALLSITLGVINLLPIPVLDGGHIFFFLIEAIKGSPVNLRVRELAQQLGLVFIFGLMLLTFYVDIERYFLDKIKALFN